MSNYVQSLNATQKTNLAAVVAEMKRVGITNPFTQAAILAIISKESNFIWQAEKGYATTSNAHIREVFTRLAKLSDTQLNVLKKNDVAFFNAIYGGMYGNAANEGYKYRGRGPNQLTFKGNYQSIGKRIGVDLVSNPDLVITDANVAAKEVVDFFVREFATASTKGYLKEYNTNSINGFINLTDSLNAVFQANRGWTKRGPDSTGGLAKAQGRITELHTILATIKEHPGATGGGAFFFDTNPVSAA